LAVSAESCLAGAGRVAADVGHGGLQHAAARGVEAVIAVPERNQSPGERAREHPDIEATVRQRGGRLQ
jgi:hypothetical protein